MNAQEFSRGVEALYRTAHHLLTTGDPRRSASLFRTMITVAPEDERGWLGLGVCHEHVDQDELAAEIYKSASIVLKTAARCELACSRVLHRLGENDDAELFRERAREHGDADVLAQLELEEAS